MIAVLSGQLVALPFSAAAQSCKGQGVEGDLSGAADIAVIVGRAAVSCSSQPAVSASDRHLETYFTLEITCSQTAKLRLMECAQRPHARPPFSLFARLIFRTDEPSLRDSSVLRSTKLWSLLVSPSPKSLRRCGR